MRRSGWLAAPAAALAVLLLAACGREEPAALRVGDLAFSTAEVGGPGAADPGALADVASWGLALRDERLDSLFAPLTLRAVERSRLETLSLVVGASAVGISEVDLANDYDRAPEWELDVRHLVRLASPTASGAERSDAEALAEEGARRARAGDDFAALAGELSQEPGAAERGGLLEPGREGSWVEPFWEAAVRLSPGEVSGVVETEYGFHVLRLDARRPVPFGEADRVRVLRRRVPAEAAIAAMEDWVAARPAATLDPAAVRSAREELAGQAWSSDRVLARAGDGGVYTSGDLALSWATLSSDEREVLLSASESDFGSWLENDVRDALWAAEAKGLGVPPLRGVEQAEMARWRGHIVRWTTTFRLAPGMPDEELRGASVAAAMDRGQEARIARRELAGLRPLLRDLYPVVVGGEAAASSSSEMRKSDSTG